MPLPIIPGVVRIAASGLIAGGGSWVNVWHARNISLASWEESGLSALHDIFEQFYLGPALGAGAPQSAFWPIGTTLVKIGYTPLDGSSGAFEFPAAAAGVGTQALPAECAAVITLRTALRGRQNRGRIYLPAPNTDDVLANGHMVPSYVTNTLTQLVAVGDLVVTGGAELGVASYGPYKNPINGVVSLDPALNGGSSPHFTRCTTFTMDDSFDVQRGRKT